ncbi:hypothetical protein HispidOSU_026082, partial [Sigmodon hispidus]
QWTPSLVAQHCEERDRFALLLSHQPHANTRLSDEQIPKVFVRRRMNKRTRSDREGPTATV